MSTEFRRPILARHTRYRWDALRREHQLLFAEGMLVLNDSGAAIARHCDGRPVAELVAAVAEAFGGAAPADEVHDFLKRLAQKGLLREAGDL